MAQFGGGNAARAVKISRINSIKITHIITGTVLYRFLKGTVIKMQKKYKGLTELINCEEAANKYYQSLPSYVKEQIDTRADSVNSFASLKDYAENLTRGDN